MAITPFEQASFNLLSFADATVDLFDSTPKDVAIQQKDSNGNVYAKTIQNRGKFQQKVWDDVGAALGQFNREFYVDAVNGDDTNDGSPSYPFRTIKKAINSVPVGGAGLIKLANNQTHLINNKIYLAKNLVQIVSWSRTSTLGSPDSDSPIVKFADDGENVIGAIFFSDGTLVFGSYHYPLIIEVGDGTASLSGIPPISGYKSIYSYDGSASLTSLQIVHSKVRTSTVFVNYVGQITIRGSAIEVLQGGIFAYCGFGTLNFQVSIGNIANGGGTDISTSCIGGIKKDANGVPRNIVSNIVF